MVEYSQSVNTAGKKISYSLRLREERHRLGLSQNALAGIMGITKWTVMNYEKQGGRGTPIPANMLLTCSKLGMDVQYIVTGVPSSNLSRVEEESGAYRPQAKGSHIGGLTSEESKLLEKYRRLKPKHRQHVQTAVDALVSTEAGAKKKASSAARKKK